MISAEAQVSDLRNTPRDETDQSDALRDLTVLDPNKALSMETVGVADLTPAFDQSPENIPFWEVTPPIHFLPFSGDGKSSFPPSVFDSPDQSIGPSTDAFETNTTTAFGGSSPEKSIASETLPVPEFHTSTGLYDAESGSFAGTLDRFEREILDLHYQRNPDGSRLSDEEYQARAAVIAHRHGLPASSEDSREKDSNNPSRPNGILAGGIGLVTSVTTGLPRRLRAVANAVNGLLIAATFTSACSPKSILPTEISPTATERPVRVSPIVPTELPTPEPILGGPILSDDQILQSLPGLPPESIEGQLVDQVFLDEDLESTLAQAGLAPVYEGTNDRQVLSDVYHIDGTTIFAVPRPETIFNAEESTYDSNGQLLRTENDTITAIDGSIVSYSDEGLDSSLGTADDVVTTKVVTVAGIPNLPEEHSVALVVVATKNNPAGPQGQLRFIVLDKNGEVMGSMPAAFGGDKNVEVTWTDGTVTTTVDGNPVNFTFQPDFLFATQTPTPQFTPTPEITATQPIQSTEILATSEPFNLDTVLVLKTFSPPEYGLAQEYRKLVPSIEQFKRDKKEAGLPNAETDSSFVGYSPQGVPIFAIYILDSYPENDSTRLGFDLTDNFMLIYGHGKITFFEMGTSSFYLTRDAFKEFPGDLWDGDISFAQLDKVDRFIDQKEFMRNVILFKGKLALIGLITRNDTTGRGPADYIGVAGGQDDPFFINTTIPTEWTDIAATSIVFVEGVTEQDIQQVLSP